MLVGHLHTHECAAGGSTDQVGNPWALDRTPGGSSGGSAAALAAGMIPLATGTDTAGSLRIPSALCGTSTIKPTRGALPLRGIFPLSGSLDHRGRWRATLADCAIALRGDGRGGEPPRPARALAARRARRAVAAAGARSTTEPDVVDGFERALEALRARSAPSSSSRRPPAAASTSAATSSTCSAPTCSATTSASAPSCATLRTSTRELLEYAEQRAMTGAEYGDTQLRRAELTARVGRLARPSTASTPCSSRPFRSSRRCAGTATTRSSPTRRSPTSRFTHYWDWTGFPVAALPSGVGAAQRAAGRACR